MYIHICICICIHIDAASILEVYFVLRRDSFFNYLEVVHFLLGRIYLVCLHTCLYVKKNAKLHDECVFEHKTMN